MGLNFYPHTATFIVETPAGQDSDGFPIPPSTQEIELVCNVQPTSEKIDQQDGDEGGQFSVVKYNVFVEPSQDISIAQNASKFRYKGLTWDVLYFREKQKFGHEVKTGTRNSG